jgi:hypothetical protein
MPRPKGQIIEREIERDGKRVARVRAPLLRLRQTALRDARRGEPREAEAELANVLADVRRGIWQPAKAQPTVAEPKPAPTFHVFASEWFEQKKLEGLEQRTLDHLQWASPAHLLAHFATLHLSQITAERRGLPRVGGTCHCANQVTFLARSLAIA